MRADRGPAGAAADDELGRVLAPMLASRPAGAAGIARVERRPSAYRTSFALDEVDVWLDDGRRLELVRKDLGARALLGGEGRIKPGFVYEPRREIEVYRRLLAPRSHLGTATFYGAVEDPGAGRFWLFLERVPGVELYQVGDLETWKAVARWLARLHTELAPLAGSATASAARLLRHDRAAMRRWMDRAQVFLGAPGRNLPEDQRHRFQRLAGCYDAVVGRLAELPATVIHGELYASNVLVQGSGAGLRVCPVDWEMAATGPALLDLAALVAGSWTDAERRELALAYRGALPPGHPVAGAAEADFMAELHLCRLHLAVQWVGWAPDWSPPPEHARDWLGEALALADLPGVIPPATRPA